MARASEDHPLWDLVAPLIADGRAAYGTIMGGGCLRSPEGEFVALPLAPDSRMGAGGSVVVKLHRDDVKALVETGEALPFGPAGKVFKEWAKITHDDESRWLELIEQALTFAASS